MLRGKVPYRDLYEQKGPLLYMLHAAAALISGKSFFGVFLIETAACTAFLYEACLLMENSCGRYALWLMPVLSGAIYASDSFCHGDSAEELCLPLTLGAYLIGHGAVHGRRALSGREWFILGVLGGAVLWIKFSFLGIFAAAAIAGIIAAVKNGRAGLLPGEISFCVLGAAAASLPVMLYFAANGAVSELFSVYFYDNLFRYGGGSSVLLRNIGNGLYFCLLFMLIPAVLICAGTVLVPLREGKASAAYFLGSAALMILTAFGGHLSYQYYPLAMAVFVPQALGTAAGTFLPELSGKDFPRRAYAAICAAGTVLCAFWCLLTSRNVYLMKYDRDELPQYIFADVIEENGGGSLLNYGFIDGGFYLAAGQVPEFRYFCLNNMAVPEMAAAQDWYISSGRADFAVVRSLKPQPEVLLPGYSIIAEAEMCYYDKKFYYFLFKCNEIDKNIISAIE